MSNIKRYTVQLDLEKYEVNISIANEGKISFYVYNKGFDRETPLFTSDEIKEIIYHLQKCIDK